MSPTRREFLRTAAAAAVPLGLGPLPLRAVRPASGGAREPVPPLPVGAHPVPGVPSPKRLLVLGGTGFIGPHMVRYAAQRGHRVTIFTRGRAEADLPEVEHLIGDRGHDLEALRGRTWDVVLDNNARDYRWVRRSTELLRDAAEHCVFVSTISVYEGEAMGYELAQRVVYEPRVDEESPRLRPPAGFRDGDEAPYGLTKALGEDLVHGAFPGRATIVRPGLIVGPGDPTDRFTWWPRRIARGGEVLAPGNPDHATQFIDQRDLTEWIVRLAEEGVAGTFNATGPASRLSMAGMLHGIRAVTPAPVRFTWVTEAFLEEHGVRPWSDLPAWIPGDPLSAVDIRRALEAGLVLRPLAVTAADVLEWDRMRAEEERRGPPPGLSPERERELLEAWRLRSAGAPS